MGQTIAVAASLPTSETKSTPSLKRACAGAATRMNFSDVRRYTPGTHCGLLPVRLRGRGSGARCIAGRRLTAASPGLRWPSSPCPKLVVRLS